MVQTCLVLALPGAFSGNLLSIWLTTRDRLRFDSALCNTGTRAVYLELSSAPLCALKLSDYDMGKPSDAVVKWAVARNVLVERVACSFYGHFQSYWGEFFQKLGRGVFEAKIGSASHLEVSLLLNCSRLVRLDLRRCELAPSLRGILVNNEHIRELRCDFGEFSHTTEDGSPSADLTGLVCPSLRFLHLVECQDAEMIGQLLRLAINLEVLLMYSCETRINEIENSLQYLSPSVLSVGIWESKITAQSLTGLVRRCPNIEHLDLDFTIDTTTAKRIGKYLQKLKTINLSCSNIEDEALFALADTCGDALTGLLVCQCYRLSGNALVKLLRQRKNITTFAASFGTIDIHAFDFRLLSNLTTLVVDYDGTKGDAFVRSLADNCLALEHCYMSLNGPKARASMMHSLVYKCTKLQSLNVEVDEGDGRIWPADVVLWQKWRPNLVVSDEFFPSYLCIVQEMPSGLSAFQMRYVF